MPAVLLVHGYSGLPETLAPLASALEQELGAQNVLLLRLPGHDPGRVPPFDGDALTGAVVSKIEDIRKAGRKLVLLGHSTGGSLALAALERSGIVPDLLMLASTPKAVDAACLDRWNLHRAGKEEISFTSVAHLIAMVNRAGRVSFRKPFPVVVLNGEQDELVPADTAFSWNQGTFNGPVRTILIPGGSHDLFRGPRSRIAIDAACRALRDFGREPSSEESLIMDRIGTAEPEALSFVKHSPASIPHLAASPGGRGAADLAPRLPPHANWEPTIANIEITTRCNLRCAYCARTLRGTAAEDMSIERFRTILGLLPHAYRVTLVGLGETLLHSNVVEFVAHIAETGRRAALVTNGMLLDERLSRELLKAGLESIALSLDGATQQLASDVRPGTDLERVTDNIRRFVEISRSGRPVSTAVFSAVSTRTVSTLQQLTELVSGLGVHVMMLSDLNFWENLSSTLWKNNSPETAALVRTAVASAFRNKLPVLSVHGLEEFGLWKRFDKFLLLPPDRLLQRSARRTWCCSPWQTIPVNVRGEVTVCDCQPDLSCGSLLEKPLEELWNGDVLVNHRERMLGDDPPEACRICPRF